jgi:hypothetical protein
LLSAVWVKLMYSRDKEALFKIKPSFFILEKIYEFIKRTRKSPGKRLYFPNHSDALWDFDLYNYDNFEGMIKTLKNCMVGYYADHNTNSRSMNL